MPLIPLPIYKPIFFASRFEPILLNKVEIQPGRVVLQLPLRGLITQIPFNPRGLLRCRSDSRSQIFKVSSRSCPFGYGPFLAKFGIFGKFGIWHLKSTLKSLQIITMTFKNKFSAMQSSVHFANKQLLNSCPNPEWEEINPPNHKTIYFLEYSAKLSEFWYLWNFLEYHKLRCST